MRPALTLLLVYSLFAQADDHGEAGLPVQTVHRLWRSISHFADESDDDSQIVLVDTRSLADRNQLLIVTAAGFPTCLTIAVFSVGIAKTAENPLRSESSTPDGNGFCEMLGIEPEVTVSKDELLVTAPIGMHSEDASHADVATYTFAWTGQTYKFGYRKLLLQFVPASERPHPR
jgi:hypothetical protein